MNIEPNSGYAALLAARNSLLAYDLDHELARRRFTWPRLASFNWALDWFDVIAENNSRVALRVVDHAGIERSVSFEALARRSSQVASWLESLGVRPGDPVLLLLDNRVEVWELMLALIKLRAIVVPTFTSVTSEELAERIDRAAVRHVIAETALVSSLNFPERLDVRVAVGATEPGWIAYTDSAEHAGEFQPAKPTSADEPLFYYFTSGTTSRPKLVVHTHVSYAIGHLTSMYWNGLRPGDVHVNMASPGWAKHPWSSLFAPWNAEATLVSLPSEKINPELILDTLSRTKATSFCAPPGVWRQLINYGLGNGRMNLREAVSVGEPLTREIVDQVRSRWGITVRNGYGQSEVTALAGVTRGLAVDPTSLGKPLPGYELVLCEPGSERPADEGELCVDLATQPLGMMRGYLDGPSDACGPGARLYRTGDLARWESDGSLTYVGRVREMYDTQHASQLPPVALEGPLYSHPAVAETAVVPVGGQDDGYVTKAFVVLNSHWNATPVTASSLFEHVEQQRQGHQRLDVLEFVDDLPHTASGKVHRDTLRHFPRSRLVEFSRTNDPGTGSGKHE